MIKFSFAFPQCMSSGLKQARKKLFMTASHIFFSSYHHLLNILQNPFLRTTFISPSYIQGMCSIDSGNNGGFMSLPPPHGTKANQLYYTHCICRNGTHIKQRARRCTDRRRKKIIVRKCDSCGLKSSSTFYCALRDLFS